MTTRGCSLTILSVTPAIGALVLESKFFCIAVEASMGSFREKVMLRSPFASHLCMQVHICKYALHLCSSSSSLMPWFGRVAVEFQQLAMTQQRFSYSDTSHSRVYDLHNTTAWCSSQWLGEGEVVRVLCPLACTVVHCIEVIFAAQQHQHGCPTLN
jgi:hypothetical protein